MSARISAGAAPVWRELQATVAKNVQEYRDYKGWSTRKLAVLSGVERVTLSDILEAEGNPTLRTLAKLAYALEVPVEALVYNRKEGC